ncbi:MAG: metallopeptidase family protein [Candidatus Dormibacteraeota bacterium]|nr:metallopeptidase family protein [Candidatus Dormibacteraeota bacterium]
MQVSMERFEEAVTAAIDSIPSQFTPFLENVQFVIEANSDDGLLGLYEGSTALDSGDGLPERVTIFKAEHEAACATWPELVAEVKRTILHEVGHHFGMDEKELPY